MLLIAGFDAHGLSYALLDAARAIELAARGSDLWPLLRDTIENPLLRTRSMTVHPFNADVDASWYFDEAFWKPYFTELAHDRYNNLTVTFSDQTNYLNPIYAHLLEVPGYPQVQVQGLSAAGRQKNLAMLRRISELAAERGLDFTLGIWMQAPVPQYSGKVLAQNLPTGLDAAGYCAAGLKSVLMACPAITGVQFRMNAEAGVSEDQQTEFYRPLFLAVRECGHPVRLDLRYKGLLPATTKAAVDAGLDVTVSTKHWCEHLGLPYHPTVVDRAYRDNRYSFGTMLKRSPGTLAQFGPTASDQRERSISPRGSVDRQPGLPARPYRVTYRLWSVGSQRLLLWGDPDYAAQFVRSCRLGEGEGFEVFAPLTNKGYGNEPGARGGSSPRRWMNTSSGSRSGIGSSRWPSAAWGTIPRLIPNVGGGSFGTDSGPPPPMSRRHTVGRAVCCP